MKRSQIALQTAIDSAVQLSISQGERTHKQLKQVVAGVLKEALYDGDISIKDGFAMLAASETSNAKQRLRAAGLIEVATASEAKPVGEISPNEFGVIDDRRNNAILGSLRNRVLFNHRHGRFNAAMEAAEMLAVTTHGEMTARQVYNGIVESATA